MGRVRAILTMLLNVCLLNVFAQTGTATEPVAYIGGEICNPRLHEGGFRYAIGTENIQVIKQLEISLFGTLNIKTVCG